MSTEAIDPALNSLLRRLRSTSETYLYPIVCWLKRGCTSIHAIVLIASRLVPSGVRVARQAATRASKSASSGSAIQSVSWAACTPARLVSLRTCAHSSLLSSKSSFGCPLVTRAPRCTAKAERCASYWTFKSGRLVVTEPVCRQWRPNWKRTSI